MPRTPLAARSAFAPLALALSLALAPSPAHAEPWVFKYDEFPEGLSQAASIIDGGQFYTQPGFVRGEAFGQIYRPAPEMFPLQIKGFDIILAAPPYASGTLTANATIEIYNSESKTPDPASSPIFAISTADLFNPVTQEFGLPLQGNTGISVEFDLSSEDNRPPVLTGGNIWLVIRFDDPAASLASEWGTLSCFQVEGLICGCQNVGTVHDSGIVKQANVIHHVTPLGTCSGAMAWSYMENIPATDTGFTIDGDVIMRLRADVASAPCVPACDGLACGDDGCGGLCGTCPADRFCVAGACVTCQPNCLSRQCGDDGCGGSCGSCGADQICGDDYFCHDDCTPDCSQNTCGPDGCGGSCGSCSDGLTCTAGRCEAACAPSCDGRACGPDGCGGTCGTCPADHTCDDGVCAAPCAPACDGAECGDDGCGGSCGTCAAGDTCDAGRCTTPPPALTITTVSPNQAFALQPTAISITGTGFSAGAQVKIGASDCSDEAVTGDGLITATAPPLGVGNYAVIVVNPDERIATLPNAFQVFPVDLVTPPVSGSSDSGCASTSPLSSIASLLLALALIARARARAD